MTDIVPASAAPAAENTGYVLVVDSDAQSLVIMAMLLERLAFSVRTASSAARAVEAAVSAPPAVALIDRDLRGMNGLALMHQLRDETANAALPVVIMARGLSPEWERRCADAGAAGCLPKPVQADALYRAVYRYIDPACRRSDLRVPTSLPASVDGHALSDGDGERVTNLSVNGLHLYVRAPLAVSSLVRIDLVLHGERISAEARVVHVRAADGGVLGAGLQFLTLPPGGREIIRSFIHHEIVHGIAPGMS